MIAGALGLCVVFFAGWAAVKDDPFGGEPIVVVAAGVRTDGGGAKPGETARNSASSGAERPNRYDGPVPGQAQAAATPPPGTRTVTIIDGTSGKRQEVPIPIAPDSKAGAIDPRLSEPSRHGPLPKIAQDGARPAEVFARAVKPLPDRPNAPRIAIVVGGLGVGTASTNDALAKLPDTVTLAFTPYGSDLPRQVAQARTDGHEVLLQIPMEPFDFPDNDPGPQTLLTSLDAPQNVDRLHWLMSRAQGYVGLVNLMGARFTAAEGALAPVLREVSKRGLIYVDDGSSPRSLASQIAGANSLAFAKADVTLDAVPTAADVDRALGRLELIARERGLAVGFAGALPVSIERIANWAKAAEARGVQLVPISAVIPKPRST
jgi:polysaccharide deacetylase 2 family uncharacterized protein YibQ